MEASAFSPAHITGFFETHRHPTEPLLSGSRGAGFSIQHGVTTKVTAKPSTKSEVRVTINGHIASDAPVSRAVAQTFLSAVRARYYVDVEHEVRVPIGAGFGSSAAAALGLALALNKALDAGLSLVEAAQTAHVVETACGTGLGAVDAERIGGLEVRLKPGAPGMGEVRRFAECEDHVAATLCLGPMSTKDTLSDSGLSRRIDEAGSGFVERLLREPSVDRFLKLSRTFAEKSGMITDRVRKVLDATDSSGYVCSVAMIGETVFSLVKPDEVESLSGVYQEHAPREASILVSHIDSKGARLL